MLFLPEKRCAEQCLERTVDERRMEAELVEFVGDRGRDGDVGDGPVLPGGHALDGSECVAVVEPDGSGAGVEVVTADRGDRLGAGRRVVRAGGAVGRVLSSAVAVMVHFEIPVGRRR